MSKKTAELIVWNRLADGPPFTHANNVLVNPKSIYARTYPHLLNTSFVAVLFCTKIEWLPTLGGYFPGALNHKWFSIEGVPYVNEDITCWAYRPEGPDRDWREDRSRTNLGAAWKGFVNGLKGKV